jgi:dTDP-4-amino-4,6-dideoxygalactose transaminase
MNGNFTAEFENWLAKKNNTKYAVTCHSGTNALEIIAQYYISKSGMPNPPRVLIPAITYVATANAFIRAGWEVTLIDTDYYGLMDFNKIDQDLSYQAVVLVGLYGAEMSHHGQLRYWQQWSGNMLIIEDAAQHWLANDCIRTGQAAAISFDPMKNLACYGNGGAVVTNDLDLLSFAREWRDNGKPNHHNTGTNSRISEVDAAQLLVKTKYIDKWQKRRAQISTYWIERLSKRKDIRTLIDSSNNHNHAHHKFVIDVDNRDILRRNLEIKKIETKIHYSQPLHELPAYRDLSGPDILSCASALSRRVLSLPIYPELTDLEVDYVIDQVLDCA